MKLISQREPALSEAIADYLDMRLTRSEVKLADQEIRPHRRERARRDVFVIQSTSYPANDNLMQLLIMMDVLRRARPGASRR